jgi:N-acetylneuraminic acid mutarotase
MLDMKKPQDGWQEMAALIKPTSHAVMISQNDKIYLIGGRMKTKSGISELYSSMYVYSITDNKWSNVKSLPYAISAGTGISIGENEIILFGGDKGETFHKTEKLISEINAEHDNAKKEALIKQKADLQSSHPGFSNEVLRYNSHKNE